MNDELRSLIDAHLDAGLDPDDERRLVALLESDPGAPTLLHDELALHHLLMATHDRAAGARVAERIPALIGDLKTPRRIATLDAVRRRLPPRRTRQRSSRPWLIAAALLLALGAGALVLQRTLDETTPLAPRLEQGSARLATDAGLRDLEPGERLPTAGRLLVSETGLTLSWPDGSRLRFNGAGTLWSEPAITGAGLCVLTGDCQAEVPSRNEGWTLATPHLRTTVLGTAFELAVDTAHSRLTVDHGAVRCQALYGDAAATILAMGSARVDSAGRMELLSAAWRGPLAGSLDMEVEHFAEASFPPARKGIREPFLESVTGAEGGTCLTVPQRGTTVGRRIHLEPGEWTLWLRWRDDNEPDPVAFSVLLDGTAIGSVTGTGRTKRWQWTAFRLPREPGGERLIELRNDFAARGEWRDPDVHPYLTATRWDRLALSSDPDWHPAPE